MTEMSGCFQLMCRLTDNTSHLVTCSSVCAQYSSNSDVVFLLFSHLQKLPLFRCCFCHDLQVLLALRKLSHSEVYVCLGLGIVIVTSEYHNL